MSNHKNIILNNNDVFVKIPYELKDHFKSTIIDAEWCSYRKLWLIDEDMIPKANQFLNEVNETLERLEAARTQLMLEDELQQLKSSLIYVNESIERQENSFTGVTEADIEAVRAQIEAAKVNLEKAKEDAQTRKLTNRELLESVCDLGLIFRSQREMTEAHYGRPNSSKRESFNNAALAIDNEHDKLKEIGFYSRALNELYNMNFNRPRRDVPNSISTEDILNLEKYEA
ncbi:hypothetical protein VO419_004391 [Vibrio parahaemolyticus]|nr:hypothetical protein [Vibrio parahaemolyticus]